MNTSYIKDNNASPKRKAGEQICGMHPGGGYVAWPDGRTTTGEAQKDRFLTVCRGFRRKGFVAWPEKEPNTFP
jgi:hypothetical protein